MVRIPKAADREHIFYVKGSCHGTFSKKLTEYILKKGIITEESLKSTSMVSNVFWNLSASTICSIVIPLFLGMISGASSFPAFLSLCGHSAAAYETYFAC